MHGGTVVAQSAGLGHGSTFIVRLPLTADPVAVASDETVAIDDEATSKLRVLVVDDNEDAAQFLAIYLRMVGHEVRCALDGAQALAVAAELEPDAVVLDIGLPDMNGYEVARRLRATPRPPRLLVALTGWGAAEDRQLAREAGFDHHLTKPADPTRVQALLATLDDP
jgi:CheY-like chemotaxis protein